MDSLGEKADSKKATLQLIIDSAPGLLWTMDNSHRPQILSSHNKAPNLALDTVQNEGWLALITDSLKNDALNLWNTHLAKMLPFELDFYLNQIDGSEAWYRFEAKPALRDDGNVERWFGSCRNIDSEKQLVETLQTALKTRSDFVAHISHELRTPLNGMLPMVELMLRGELNDEARSLALTLNEAGNSLLNIINDILDFSKLEAGKVHPDKSAFNLVAIVDGVAQILTPAAASKGLLLLSSISSEVPQIVIGDAQRLRQVLLNLCGNAIKFTDHGEVIMRVVASAPIGGVAGITFCVSDSGPGLSQETIAQLFQPFFQGSGEAYRNQAGTGLGLSISKKFVELMGGNIFVESSPGEGSTFGFSLPLPQKEETDINGVWMPAFKRPIKLAAVIFEPCNQGQNLIGEIFQNLGLNVKSVDNSDLALDILKKQISDQTPQILVVDMVRNAAPSKALVERFAAYDTQSVKSIIEVVSTDTTENREQSSGNLRRVKLAMPLQQESVRKCLRSFEDSPHKEAENNASMTTLQLEQVVVEPFLGKSKLSGEKKTVLVGDDNEINRRVLNLFLMEMGFAVDLATDGVEVVQAFKSKHYDLVFLDCQMPRLDGFAAAKIMKELQARRGIAVPIIAITANAAEGTREECLARDMDDYLSKPISAAVLEKLVESWLGSTPKKQSPPSLRAGSKMPGAQNRALVDFVKMRGQFNEAQMKTILEAFIDSCPASLDEMRRLLARKNHATCERKLESFKGSCITIGCVAMVTVCEGIEMSMQRGDNTGAEKGLESIAQLLEKLGNEVSEAFADRSTITMPKILNS